jgi:hypothetical protein
MVHISEEAKNANTAIPYGILLAAVSSIVLGWGKLFGLFLRPVHTYSKIFNRSQCGLGLQHGNGSTEYRQ